MEYVNLRVLPDKATQMALVAMVITRVNLARKGQYTRVNLARKGQYMTAIDCACDRFARLEGAAIQAYISQFLERTGVDEQGRRTHYVCRFCGRSWLRIEDVDSRKTSLIRQETEFNV